MPAIRGESVLIKAETSAGVFTTIAAQRGGKLNLSAEMLDITTKDGLGWKQKLPGQLDWSIDCDGLFIQTDAAFQKLLDSFKARTTLKAQFVRPDGKIFEGNVYVSSIPLDAPYDGISTYECTFDGDGEPTKFFV